MVWGGACKDTLWFSSQKAHQFPVPKRVGSAAKPAGTRSAAQLVPNGLGPVCNPSRKRRSFHPCAQVPSSLGHSSPAEPSPCSLMQIVVFYMCSDPTHPCLPSLSEFSEQAKSQLCRSPRAAPQPSLMVVLQVNSAKRTLLFWLLLYSQYYKICFEFCNFVAFYMMCLYLIV